MAKLFVICGHGAGDSGACGNGYQEQERVRALGKRIKELGGSSVMLGDMNRNYYADNGITSLNISKDYQIIELHMDSAAASARGAHVIIYGGYEADTYDKALAKFLTGLFPGRANSIVGRNDLANPARAAARGYSYRLVECGFISNSTDVSIFNSNLDNIAKGILGCFGIGAAESEPVPTPTPSKKSNAVVAQEVLKGIWGNGADRKARLESAGYNYDVIQGLVNSLCGAPTPSKKSVSEIADEVLLGKWGNGNDRKTRLTAAGYNYEEVQAVVNKKVGGTSSRKSNAEIAKEVMRGDWGNGEERRKRLAAAGYDYNAIQAIVNTL